MKYHEPVLLKEVIAYLKPNSNGLYVDANLGTGGHALAILEASYPNGWVVGFEWDEEAFRISKKRLAKYTKRVKIFQKNFSELLTTLRDKKIFQADGVLFDLGLSSLQIEKAERGFSYLNDGPLDMRMSRTNPTMAADLINNGSQEELEKIIFEYGEEPLARRIAAGLLHGRQKAAVKTTAELRKNIEKTLAGRPPKVIKNAVIRTFQAFRIAVNNELNNLKQGLEAAVEILKPGGRLLVISFHSLEDRIVKKFLRTEAKNCLCPPRSPVCVCGHKARLKEITRRPTQPTEEEILKNTRSDSAKLRVAERI